MKIASEVLLVLCMLASFILGAGFGYSSGLREGITKGFNRRKSLEKYDAR